jgi:hypothetical protein
MTASLQAARVRVRGHARVADVDDAERLVALGQVGALGDLEVGDLVVADRVVAVDDLAVDQHVGPPFERDDLRVVDVVAGAGDERVAAQELLDGDHLVHRGVAGPGAAVLALEVLDRQERLVASKMKLVLLAITSSFHCPC